MSEKFSSRQKLKLALYCARPLHKKDSFSDTASQEREVSSIERLQSIANSWDVSLAELVLQESSINIKQLKEYQREKMDETAILERRKLRIDRVKSIYGDEIMTDENRKSFLLAGNIDSKLKEIAMESAHQETLL
ncbi:hypothetical protein HDV04_004017 [Boothiomyces sp. JEL0838]|nr:hypothetical protein HDV04_004017 [Boothiomyces sp. JEL0838]